MLSRAARDLHRRAATQVEHSRRARSVCGDFQMLAAAEKRAQLAWSRIRVGGHVLANLMRPCLNLERATFRRGNLVEGLSIDIGDQISEPVDAQHFADNAIVLDLR